MSSNKSSELKQFLISERDHVAPGVTNAPVWAMQKKGSHIWNKKGKRHWRSTDFGNKFRKKMRKEGK